MIYLINKEKGMSSFGAIKKFAKEKNIQKIGHTGTLDPLATGLILVATDDDTSLIPYIDEGFKKYVAKMQFGYKSDTYDIEGNVEKVICNKTHSLAEINKVIRENFIGLINQFPPIFSAKKVNGKRSYKLAREGKEVILKAQQVEIKSFNILSWDPKNQILELEFQVSRGTYIRSLIHDLAKKLDCHAIMIELERTELNNLTKMDLNKTLDPFKIINLKQYQLTKIQLIDLYRGIKLEITNFQNYQSKEFLLIFENKIMGIGLIEAEKLKSKKIFGKKIERILNEQQI
ncbi:tRNA pseudouridine(55) synthase TruB [Mycoplasma iguanae]|uniref:tRNA pseudouridine synthase B n=1 Tax=Mycoplasma iguanae TaxID=292461 RepID=A0ABY5R9Y4_9MOLU|nr:tRNA pseudouridine(55) synthase TruB [Mycoplasma iguanae]UVD81577.1 tRNA pseudouridine(55) synthase TruB [Mycoplasma iguanae]